MRAVLVLFLCIPKAFGVSLKIDGVIDLGPQWNYMYKILGNDNIEPKKPPHEVELTRDTFDSDHELFKVPENTTHHEKEKKEVVREFKDSRPDVEPDIEESSDESSEAPQDTRVTKIVSGADDTEDTENESSLINTEYRFKSLNNPNEGRKKRKKKRKFKNKRILRNSDIENDSKELFKESTAKKKRDIQEKNAAFKERYQNKDKSYKNTPHQIRGFTGFHSKAKYVNNLFVKRHKIKDDIVANGFIVHIYKQALKTVDAMNLHNKGVSQSTLDTLKKTFEKEFGDFVAKTREHSIRTRSGMNRLILNAIDTSNRMLYRLTSLLTTEQQAEMLQKELVKHGDIEYKHACSKLGVCRSGTAFSDFLLEFLTKLITSSDTNIMQASNALTEAVKNTDFTDIVENSTQKKIRGFIEKLELMPVFFVKATFLIFRAVIAGKNKPLELTYQSDINASNKTVAARELLQTLDEAIAEGADLNALKNVNEKLEEWKNGKFKDILSIMEQLVKTIKDALTKLSEKAKRLIDLFLKTMLQHFK